MGYISLRSHNKMNKELLILRNKLKRKKPTFVRQDSHKVKSLDPRWRSPRGQHSKMRKKLRGYRRLPSVGWSSPAEVRGLSRNGLRVSLAYNASDLAGKEAVIISSRVGLKKRIEMLQKAKELKLNVLNIKEPEEYIKRSQEILRERRESKKLSAALKTKTREETKKKAEEKPREEAAEDKEKRELEEKRKVLEQR